VETGFLASVITFILYRSVFLLFLDTLLSGAYSFAQALSSAVASPGILLRLLFS
jgi:hypothetical protein